MRRKVKQLIRELARENPKVPSNMLHALSNVSPSQLMDRSLWDFRALKTDGCSTTDSLEIDLAPTVADDEDANDIISRFPLERLHQSAVGED